MSTPENIYIVSGNIAEFKYITKKKWDHYTETWAKGHKQEMYPNYKYVSSVDILKGLAEIKGFYYGTYEQRTDIDRIKLEIALIKSKHGLRFGATHAISINGVLQDARDYKITFQAFAKETVVDFNQAPPAFSNVTITEIMTGSTRHATGNGTTFRFHFPF